MPDAADWRGELAELETLSARIGADPLLTQGAGGNTSLKFDGTLWIKASGTWLAHALERRIMVPVEIEPLLAAVRSIDPAAEEAQRFTIASLNPAGLRPSIETTVHALMPQRVVLHVHCVDTIAHAVRDDCVEQVTSRLDGLNWAYIPYARPGLPLALAIAENSTSRPDVLILANHGLVVAAGSVQQAETLLNDVKRRLRIEPRLAPSANLEWLAELAGAGYCLPDSAATHALATDPVSTARTAGRAMYPDHIIFLGDGPAIAQPDENAAAVIDRLGAPPIAIVFPGVGVLMRADSPPGADAMVRCLADVVARLPADAPVRVLTPEEYLQLTDWDAEKYRQQLARKARSVGAAQKIA